MLKHAFSEHLSFVVHDYSLCIKKKCAHTNTNTECRSGILRRNRVSKKQREKNSGKEHGENVFHLEVSLLCWNITSTLCGFYIIRSSILQTAQRTSQSRHSRHCERSEAIQRITIELLDCFVS